MGYCVTTPEREKVRQKKLTCTQKTASREIFSYCVETSQENRSQAPELHQGNRLTTTKIASGIPYWPSRDPIEEEGGINLYSFLKNNGLSNVDVIGLACNGEVIKAADNEEWKLTDISETGGTANGIAIIQSVTLRWERGSAAKCCCADKSIEYKWNLTMTTQGTATGPWAIPRPGGGFGAIPVVTNPGVDIIAEAGKSSLADLLNGLFANTPEYQRMLALMLGTKPDMDFVGGFKGGNPCE